MVDAATGQLIDSPSGRVARAKEIDAAWQQLWQAEYTGHIDDALRAAFEEDYRTWQQIKEQIAKMGVVSLMGPATGDLLERWHVRAADWFGRFKEQSVKMAAPAPKPDAPGFHFNWQGPTGLAWAVAGIIGGGALMILASKYAAGAGVRGRVAA